jgi:hypothetical protein
MTSAELLVDAFGRIREVVHRVVDGLTPEQLAFRVDPEANSIGWLVWHLTRIQDDHLADAFQGEQVWTSQAGGSGSGCRSIPGPPAMGTGSRRCRRAGGLGRVAGELPRRGPPADDPVRGPAHGCRSCPHRGPLVGSAGVAGGAAGERDRDDLQHAGQAAFVRGILQHR